MQVPPDLQGALDSAIEAFSPRELASSAQALSARYRSRNEGDGASYLRTPVDVAAYAAYRLPATYAAARSALDQVGERRRDWRPRRLLDAGSGPGTLLWAATAVWPTIERITAVERDPGMAAFGRQLAAAAPNAAIRTAHWLDADLTAMPSALQTTSERAAGWAGEPYDLVTISYAIGELPDALRLEMVRKLWSITSDTLILIEPGTPAGAARIAHARAELLAQGALTIAPCPHDAACPLAKGDWCHFAQRVSRSRLHRLVKASELPYEDEKFSFAALSKEPQSPADFARVIRHPQSRMGHIRLELCTPDGLAQEVASRKDKARFRSARDARWGSALPLDR